MGQAAPNDLGVDALPPLGEACPLCLACLRSAGLVARAIRLRFCRMCRRAHGGQDQSADQQEAEQDPADQPPVTSKKRRHRRCLSVLSDADRRVPSL